MYVHWGICVCMWVHRGLIGDRMCACVHRGDQYTYVYLCLCYTETCKKNSGFSFPTLSFLNNVFLTIIQPLLHKVYSNVPNYKPFWLFFYIYFCYASRYNIMSRYSKWMNKKSKRLIIWNEDGTFSHLFTFTFIFRKTHYLIGYICWAVILMM
jgi:hypothetical protein